VAVTSRWTRSGREAPGADEATIVYRAAWPSSPPSGRGSPRRTEGIRFELQVAPLEVLGDENRWVTGIRCIRMELGRTGRVRPPATHPDRGLRVRDRLRDGRGGDRNALEPVLTASEPDLALNKEGYIVTDEHGMSSLRGVFAAATSCAGRPRDPGDGRRQAGRRVGRRLAARGYPPRVEAEPTVQSPMPAARAARALSTTRPGRGAGSARCTSLRGRCVHAAAAAGAGPPAPATARVVGRVQPVGDVAGDLVGGGSAPVSSHRGRGPSRCRRRASRRPRWTHHGVPISSWRRRACRSRPCRRRRPSCVA